MARKPAPPKKSGATNKRTRALRAPRALKPAKPAQHAGKAQAASRQAGQNGTSHARAREQAPPPVQSAVQALGGAELVQHIAANRVSIVPVLDLEPGADDTLAKIMRVLADPKFIGATMEAKAEAAGVSRSTLYRNLDDPETATRLRDAYRRALRGYIGPVLGALALAAGDPDPRCTRDRAMFLEMVGLHVPSSSKPGEAEGEGANKAAAGAELDDQELLAACVEAGAKLPPGVVRRLRMAGKLPPELAAAVQEGRGDASKQ